MRTRIALIALTGLLCGCGDSKREAELERRVQALEALQANTSSNLVAAMDSVAANIRMQSEYNSNQARVEEKLMQAWRDQQQEISALEVNQRQVSSNRSGNSK